MVLTFVGIAGAVTDTEKFSGQSGPYKMSFTYGNASKYSNVSIFREGRSTEDYTYDPLVGWDKTGGYGMAVVFNDSHTVEVILSVIPRSSRMELSDKEFRDKTWVVSYSKLAEARNEPYKVWTLNNRPWVISLDSYGDYTAYSFYSKKEALFVSAPKDKRDFLWDMLSTLHLEGSIDQ